MVRRLGLYQEANPAVMATEAQVRAETDQGVSIVGRVDRLERAQGTDQARVVDFKTGKVIPPKEDTQSNAQLGAYQLAVNQGAVRGKDGELYQAEDAAPLRADGARLVFLGSGKNAPAERFQPALADSPDPGWVGELLERCRERATQAEFTAITGPKCRSCAVKPCCPAFDEGRQVTA
jgi:RecB family exonuclease